MTSADEKIRKRVELIAPAGSLLKLKTAVLYGADAVYCGLSDLNLRMRAKNFTREEMEEGINFAHNFGAKVYITLNAFLFERDLKLFEQLASEAVELKPDAIIISDPAAIVWFRKNAPHIRFHLSTQAGAMNSIASNFWCEQGVSRIIFARELTLEDLKNIRENAKCEMEIFVQGAMCMSISGRCLLSSYLCGREADKGDCQQPCRWVYSIKDVQGDESTFPVIENENGTTILSAKDLCLFDYLPELIELGIDGFKIEGRIKTEYYVAGVVRAYRHAIDLYYADSQNYQTPEKWRDELFKISHREYSTGFLFGTEKISQTYRVESFIKNTVFKAVVIEKCYNEYKGWVKLIVKDSIIAGDEMEVMTPHNDFNVKIEELKNVDKKDINSASPGEIVFAKIIPQVEPFTFLRVLCPPPFLRI